PYRTVLSPNATAVLCGTYTRVRDIMAPHDSTPNGQGSRGNDGRTRVPGMAPGHLGADANGTAAVRTQGDRLPGPRRHQRRVGDLPEMVRCPVQRDVNAGRRDLAVPVRGGAGDPLPRSAAVPGVRHRVLRAGLRRRPDHAGDAAVRRARSR